MIIEKLDKWARGQFVQATRAFPFNFSIADII